MRERRKTRQVRAGNLFIGGDAPVSIQTMTNIPVTRVADTIDQVQKLARQGAQLVRIAFRSVDEVKFLKEIIPEVAVPLSADVHFDYRIAVSAIDAGISKVRINPGNIGSDAGVAEVVRAAKDNGVSIRIGVNGGSLDRKKYHEVTPENLASSAVDHVKILEDNGFNDIVVSLKSSDIGQTIEANRIFSANSDYPVHIGITEAGYGETCIVQSSVALGHLLLNGIGDTMRVSMTGDPAQELPVARKILESVGDRAARVRLISCPTCGRTDPGLDILELARSVEEAVAEQFGKELEDKKTTLTVAIMGCEVNGPGEAREADIGLAGIRGGYLLLFARGEKLRKVNRDDAVTELVEEAEKIIDAL